MDFSFWTPDVSQERPHGRGFGHWGVELPVEPVPAPLHWRHGSRKHMHLETKRDCPVYGSGLGKVIRSLGY